METQELLLLFPNVFGLQLCFAFKALLHCGFGMKNGAPVKIFSDQEQQIKKENQNLVHEGPLSEN